MKNNTFKDLVKKQTSHIKNHEMFSTLQIVIPSVTECNGPSCSDKLLIKQMYLDENINGVWHGPGEWQQFSISIEDARKYEPCVSVLCEYVKQETI